MSGVDVRVFFADLLLSGRAEQRMWGIDRWCEYLGECEDLLPLLDDDAPVVRGHAGRGVLVEVRAAALVALQDRHRHAAGGWPHGAVTVRKAMPVDEAVAQARDLVARLEPGRRVEVERLVVQALGERVDPPAADNEACLAYCTLQVLGAVPYRHEDVDPVTMLTSLQVQVHASQMVSPRPTPHVRFDGPHGPVGYLYRTDRWVLDFDESPTARDICQMVQQVQRLERGGVPRIAFGPDGNPLCNEDGSFQMAGAVPDDDNHTTEYLRCIAAFVARQHSCSLVTDPD